MFHPGRPKPLLNKLADAILPLHTLLGLMKAQKVPDADATSKIAKVTKRNAVGVGCAEQGPDTGADDGGNGYLLLPKNLQYAEMRESTREAATECHDNARTGIYSGYAAGLQFRWWLAIELWVGITVGRHASSLAQ